MGLEVITVVATVAGTVIGAVGQMQQQAAAQAQANYQAQVAENNQIIARQNAQYARQAAEAQVQRQNEKTAAMVGAIRAAQASNNLDVNTGSALEVQSSAEALGQLDAVSIREAGERQARAFENQGRGFADQAGLYGMQASAAAPSALSLFGSVLGGTGAVADKWLRYNQQGINLLS